MQRILTFIVWLPGLCLQWLRHRFIAWTTPDTCNGYLAQPFKKDGWAVQITLFPWTPNSMEGQGEPIHLAGWRGEASIRQDKQVLAAYAPESERDAGERTSFKGILTIDDDKLAHLDSRMKGRRRCLLVKPPSASHGAARLRSEQQAPWFLRAQWHEIIQRLRESAGVSLDVVVLD